MITLGYTVLVLAIAAVALFFWQKYNSLKAATVARAKRRMMNAKLKEQGEKYADLEARFADLEVRARKELGFQAPSANPFVNSEDRHAKALKQVVEVGHTAVNKAA